MHLPLQSGAGDVAVAIVDCVECAAADGNQIFSERPQLLAQHNELAADASDGLAVVFPEVRDGLEIRHQPPSQPHQSHLLEALRQPAVPAGRSDLDAGTGRDTFALLGRGWLVQALDANPEALSEIARKMPEAWRCRELRQAFLESLELAPSELINLSIALPSCQPNTSLTYGEK